MRLATWNVNSVRTRVDRIVDFAVREDIDVLAMQEIKCKVEQFPFEQFEQAGFEGGLNWYRNMDVNASLTGIRWYAFFI